MKIHLMGRHAHRIPFAYEVYRSILKKSFEYVTDPFEADIILFGYIINIDENVDVLKKVLAKRKHVRLVVFSEEPLWDTTNSGNFKVKIVERLVENFAFKCTVINHVTSDIYSFNKFPYFITTSDDYYLRYLQAFKRNADLKVENVLNIWKDAGYKYAFFAENRQLVKKYSISHPDINVYGLSVYRTNIAKNIKDKKTAECLCVGKGWQKEDSARQQLVDWHLDKLALLTYNSFIVSAIENTVQKNYISEKIFDSYATLGVPIYWADQQHSLFKIINKDSALINVSGLNEQQAIDKILSVQPTRELGEIYLETQQLLAKHFERYDEFIYSRMEFSDKFNDAILSISAQD
ncbi:hypothetical protein QTA56_15175 [Acinetobacter sp. VNH17]|uniref:Glycosyltransferase n=1 Tax=Acinetobacter thutiue TaxID=2998078 RepID=A0ABT7WSE8_9GAMM|nr:hypothetical protein [Acinetobacter thutiue]MCY6413454.1 hypothetical protein [Acinetobacter thutiue]MDN0015563.1 hypothetical protein [Acinetobacter thutiue]